VPPPENQLMPWNVSDGPCFLTGGCVRPLRHFYGYATGQVAAPSTGPASTQVTDLLTDL